MCIRDSEIVSAKSDDRRQIFEEAAGITKFRYRKYESERRLKLAEENLVRLRDILGELEGRIGPLKTQSEKAKQFIELAERKKTLEISLWSDQLSASRQKLREQDDKILAMQQSHGQASESLEQIAAQIQQAYQNIQDTQVKIESIRSEKEDNERKIAENHSLIAVLNNDISHNLADIQRIISELDSCESSGEQIEQEKQARSQELSELDAKPVSYTHLRELEIRDFVPKEYWTIDASLLKEGARKPFAAKLHSKDGKKIEVENKEQSDAILKDLEGAEYIVASVKKGKRQKSPAAPFTTSTMQQEASRKLGFQAYRTMKAAQELYEGGTVEGMGAVGLITYMRTDSMRISDEARQAASNYITSKYGELYLPDKPRVFKSKSNAQDRCV